MFFSVFRVVMVLLMCCLMIWWVIRIIGIRLFCFLVFFCMIDLMLMLCLDRMVVIWVSMFGWFLVWMCRQQVFLQVLIGRIGWLDSVFGWNVRCGMWFFGLEVMVWIMLMRLVIIEEVVGFILVLVLQQRVELMVLLLIIIVFIMLLMLVIR